MSHTAPITPPSQASKDYAFYQVTEWGAPRSRVNDTDYEIWLQIEVDRFREKWTEAWVQVNSATGEVALFTWSGTQKPVDGDDPK